MTLHEAVAGMLQRGNLVARRPSGKALILNGTTYLLQPGRKGWTYANLQASDILNEEWELEELPEHKEAASNGGA